MNNEFFDALELLESEKGIAKEYMIEKVEAALMTAYKKEAAGQENVRIAIDPEKRRVKMYMQRTVVEEVTDPECEISLEDAREIKKRIKVGDVIEKEIKPKAFGRIPAQTAKMVIIQGIREAERGQMIQEYEEKKEDILTARVRLIDPKTGNAILELGKNQFTLTRAEMLPQDNFVAGDHIRVYVMEVKKESRGPIVMISRTHPGLVRRLFEREVPEIQDGTVLIHSVAREAGSRTKIAVYSNDENVDPIGACIGVKGLRKQGITSELGGEKIDIVKYSEDAAEFIEAALSPATVLSVAVAEDKSCRVLVAPDQLSLAIGREGQNARLAARLTGYKIDIKAAL
ncbi:MAG: transcription termination/antitermination protein NusA [Clostridia bacterium]|nr:transcription termination/antitermination protein NusA [Clostridia bacterium]